MLSALFSFLPRRQQALKRYLSFFLCLIVVLLLSYLTYNTYSVELKISASVRQEIQAGNEELEVLIYMSEQLDTEKVLKQSKNTLCSISDTVKVKKETRKVVANSLKDVAEVSQASLLKHLRKMEEKGLASDVESFFIVNMIYAVISPDMVQEIAARSDVKHIYLNEIITLDVPESDDTLFIHQDDSIAWNIDHIGAPAVWSKYGIDGEGVVIGIIDTGVDWEHPALKAVWRGYSQEEIVADYNWYDAVYKESMPSDVHGHGTSVIGIALGFNRNDEQYTGVAPGATWIACRGLYNNGTGNKQLLLRAGQFMLAPTDVDGENPDPERAPDIIINSWGGNLGEDNWYLDMINNWRSAQIFPIFAAGNSGPKENTIHNPANYPGTFAVGAVDSNNKLAGFSSRGPGVYGDFIKPELVAPGVQVFTTRIGNNYGYENGSSMAAPHVAGAAALLLSYRPSLSIEELENILRETAEPLTDQNYPISPNYGYGYGLVNPLLAIDSLASTHYSLSILVNGQGSTEPKPGIYVIPEGEEFTVEAISEDGWSFQKWDIDGVIITEIILSMIVDHDIEATAYFEEIIISNDWLLIDSPANPIGLNESLLVTLNRSFTTEEIKEIVIEHEYSFIDLKITLKEDEKQVIVTPVDPYLPGETYCLKIFLSNQKQYKMIFDTEDF